MAVARELTYQDFDMLLERAGQNAYRVRVVNAPAGPTPSISFTVPFSQLELENFVLKIGRPRRVVRRVDAPETTAIKSFGGQLYSALFHDELEVNLRRSLTEAAAKRAGLRIRLRLSDAPELAELPWEFLYDRTRNSFLALAHRTPLVRFLEVPDPPRPLLVSPPLRVLVMIASPSDYPQLDVEQEWAKLGDALGPLEQAGHVQMERLEAATLAALRQRLRRDDWHVFHFIGHGGFDQDTQDGVLLLEDQAGRGLRVSGQDLGVLLNDHDSLRLVVFNACEGARADPSDPFAGTAQSLLQRGVPAVVAMQFEITDPAAIKFAQELYAAVADGYPLDAAVTEARKAIWADGNQVEWATPVLYLCAPDGRIFDVLPTSIDDEDAERARALAEQEASEQRARALAEQEASEQRARAQAEQEASEQWAREQTEKRATRVRVVGDRVDRAEALFRRREYVPALSLCAEVLQEFGNSADPALHAYIQRARELSQQAKKQLFRRRWRRWSLVAIAPAVAIGIFLGLRLNGTGSGGKSVEVPATRAWTDTSVDCKAGDVLEIAATGGIAHKPGGDLVGPDGNPDPKVRDTHPEAPMPNVNHAALIGSIDGEPPYFPVNKKTNHTCDAAGRLFLGINDEGVDNNSGRFRATITGGS
jgi:CHAT domain